MDWRDWVLLLGFAVTVVEFLLIYGIYRDDHAMLTVSKESLAISRESLKAQNNYLAFRQRQREAKKDKKEEKTDGVTKNEGPQVAS